MAADNEWEPLAIDGALDHVERFEHELALDGNVVLKFWLHLPKSVLEKRLASDDSLVGSLPLSGRPRHLSMRYDDSRLFVSNFVTPPIPGESTTVVDVASPIVSIARFAAPKLPYSSG